MRPLVRAAAVLLCFSAGAANAASFSVNDWSGATGAPQNIFTVPNLTNFSVTDNAAFGSSGSGLQVQSSLSGGSAQTHQFIGFIGLSYDPGLQGAVASFDYSIDQRRTVGQGHGWGLGFKQGSNIYILDLFSRFRNTNTPSNQSVYRTFAESGLTTADTRVTPNSTSSLDLSSLGAQIDFGLVIFSGNGGASSRSDTTQYDQFSITFNQVSAVPVPAALPLLVAVLAGFGLMGWRKSKLA